MARFLYPAITCKEVKSILKAYGFTQKSSNNGSHESWVRTDKNGVLHKVTVDCPKAPFSVDLIKSMIKQSGLSRVEFYRGAKTTAKKINKKHFTKTEIATRLGLNS